ncbi:D-ribose-binding periplasmic protein precursor [uncultured Roseburia sp.]|uniref:Sugar ABC transporter substrate-binding protein n=1 Tax=Brotonthovivens ammoniilytica TaxID=2981725 RepID=A0ABT2TN60_9FIRM|nr:sugar ABC transporter substrate-binding protein [Brotonthovivens ammoniilytica]MCU6763655.1 sugar ABC transporter substrate-binding protein [Brotonthovivens ammoniilytica]SCJ29584.1 D-ribose-binding periplasmic protein precursor [uncultured Roseburia sp.]
MKKVLKKLLCVGLAAVLILSMAACGKQEGGNGSSKEGGAGKEALTIGFAFRSLDEAMTGWWEKTEELIEAYNKDDSNPYTIEYFFTNANLDVDTQLSDVDSLIARNPDVICIQAVDSDGSVPAFEACTSAEIPVIDFGFGINYEDYTASLLTIDHYGAGVAQADWLKKYLDENKDVTLNVGYINGAQGVKQMTERYEGLCTLFEDEAYKDRAKLLEMQYCNFSADTALSQMEDWMQTYPEMNCVVSANDEMVMGAMQACASANVKMVSLGMDATQTGLQGIKDGLESATIGFDFDIIAENGLNLAIAVASDKTFEKTTDISKEVTYIVDSSNIDEYVK